MAVGRMWPCYSPGPVRVCTCRRGRRKPTSCPRRSRWWGRSTSQGRTRRLVVTTGDVVPKCILPSVSNIGYERGWPLFGHLRWKMLELSLRFVDHRVEKYHLMFRSESASKHPVGFGHDRSGDDEPFIRREQVTARSVVRLVVAARLEQHARVDDEHSDLGHELSSPAGQLLAIPETGAAEGGDSDGDPVTNPANALAADIAGAQGRAVLLETTQDGYGEERAEAPQRDWSPARLGPVLPVGVTEAARDALCAHSERVRRAARNVRAESRWHSSARSSAPLPAVCRGTRRETHRARSTDQAWHRMQLRIRPPPVTG